jgi:hypothetical protein
MRVVVDRAAGDDPAVDGTTVDGAADAEVEGAAVGCVWLGVLGGPLQAEATAATAAAAISASEKRRTGTVTGPW